jgi:hypothetical protein
MPIQIYHYFQSIKKIVVCPHVLLALIVFIGVWGIPYTPAATQDGTQIRPGQVVNGRLSAEVLSAVYRFSGMADDRVSITLSSRSFDAFLRLESQNGELVASNDDTQGSLNAALENIILPGDDTYVIVVTSSNGRGQGDYTLVMNYFQVVEIAYGAVIEGTFDSTTTSAIYRFEGEQGDIVNISMNSEQIDSNLRLSTPEYELAFDDDSGGNRNALISGMILPTTGVYFVTASSFAQNAVGSFTVSLTKAEMIPVAANSQTSVLMQGEPILFSYQGRVGERLMAYVESDNVDTILNIKGPTGGFVGWDDDSGTGLNPEISRVFLDTEGNYILSILPFSSETTGEISLVLEIEPPPLVQCDTSQTLVFNPKAQQYMFLLEAQAGSIVEVMLLAHGFTGENLNMNIIQNGMYLNFPGSFGDSQVKGIVDFSADGWALIQIYNFYYGSTTLEMSIECS